MGQYQTRMVRELRQIFPEPDITTLDWLTRLDALEDLFSDVEPEILYGDDRFTEMCINRGWTPPP